MDLNRNNMLKLGCLIAFGILFYVVVSKLGNVLGFVQTLMRILFPIVLGACMAFILNIPMRGFERLLLRCKDKGPGRFVRRHKRAFALVMALVAVVAVLTLVLCIIIPQIGITLSDIPDTFMAFWDRLVAWANETAWVKEYILPHLDINSVDWKQIWNSFGDFVFSGAGTIISLSISFASTLFGAIVDFVLALFFAVYILVEKDTLGLQGKKILYAYFKKETVEKVIGFLRLASTTFSNFFAVQCVEACILGMLFFIVMTLFQFPYALAISVSIALTALIPVCGAFIGCAIGAFLIVMVSPVKALWFIVVFLVLQQLENNLIYPKVVGDTIGLPAIWVLAAITTGGSLLGIPGMLIFVPLFSVLYVVFRGVVAKRLKKRHIQIADDGTVIWCEEPKEAEQESTEE